MEVAAVAVAAGERKEVDAMKFYFIRFEREGNER